MRLPVLIAVLLLLLTSPLRAASRVEAIFADVPSDGGWVPVTVTVDVPAPGGIVWIRDGRGGVEFGRPVDPGEKKTVVLSLPLLSPRGLQTDTGLAWPVRVRVGPLAEEAAKPATAGDTLPVEKAPAARPKPFIHIAVPASGDSLENLAAILAAEGDPGMSAASIPDDELLTAPPLALAGIDAVILTPRLAGAMTAERAVALMAVGIRLVYPGGIPPAGPLASLKWTQREDVWIAPLEATAMPLSRCLAAPLVADKSLEKLPAYAPAAPRALTAVALWLTPAVIVLILFVRVITSRAGVIAAILAVCLSIGAALTVAALSATTVPEQHDVSWTSRSAPGNLAVTETLLVRNALFPADLDIPSPDPVPALPLVASPESWFVLARGESGGDRLLLDSRTLPTQRVARFWGRQNPRQPRAFLTRTVTAAWPLPSDPADPAWQRDLAQHRVDITAGTRIANGYVLRDGAKGAELTAWIATHPPAVRASLNAWYELRFWGARSYQIQTTDNRTTIIDFGERP